MNSGTPFPDDPKSDPRFYRAENKKPGSPLVVFLHFYGGHQKVMRRHIHLVNQLGYDAFAFNIPKFPDIKISLWHRGRFGAKHVYARILEYFLNQIPEKKIIFAFSNPCASAIEALDDRGFDKKDVIALICDSGPSGAFLRSAWNLAIKVQKSPILLGMFAGFWSWGFHRELDRQLRRFPQNFPVLSIRGGQDNVIPPWHIERVFNSQAHLRVQVAEIQNAGHLDALKLFPEEYSNHLKSFLESL